MMHFKQYRRWFLLPLATLSAVSACNVVLGLDDYTPAGGTGANACIPGTQKVCLYTGLPGTENVGPCRAGFQVCNTEGTGYEACSGEITPAPMENCSNTIDDTCDGQVNEACPCEPGAMIACYTGPAGSENVGICKGGMQACNQDGLGYGPCSDQPPLVEDCAMASDEDCDGFVCGSTLWATNLDGVKVEGVTVDNAGHIVVVGALYGTFSSGNVNLSTAGGNDVVVLAFNAAGTILWGKRFGSTPSESAYAVDTDAMGNVYVTGAIDGAVDFGGGQVSAGVFMVKLDPKGAHVWSKSCGGTTASPRTTGYALDVDGQGNVLVTGTFGGTISCAIGKSVTSAGGSDVFVVRMSGTNGGPVWLKAFGDVSNTQIGRGIAATSDGDALVTGTFLGSIDFGGGLVTAASSGSLFAAKLTAANGAHVWTTTGSNASSDGEAIAVDAANNPILVGSYSGTLTMGATSLPLVGGASDILFGKLDGANGAASWLRGYGNANGDGGQAVAVGPTGRIAAAGRFRNSADFGGGPLASGGLDAAFVAVFDDMGKHLWSKQFSGSQLGINETTSVAFGPASEVVAAGNFVGMVDFGSGPVMAASGGSGFVVRIAP